ncbi:TPA: drug/metabolite exporter YedA [Escherichia coli]|nr:drug/metabolite exporter YedA [Escherichia coli]
MSDNLPWKTWTPDDLAPPQAEFVPMVEPEETIIEEAEPSLEQQLAQLQMQAHEQGYQAGIAIGLAGIIMLNSGGNLSGNPWGAILILIGSISWAFGSVYGSRITLPVGMMAGAIEMLAAGVVLMIASMIAGEKLTALPSLSGFLAVGYLALFGSIIAINAYMYLIRNVSPALATSYAYVNPVVAVLLGTGLGGETLSKIEWLALGVIVFAVVLVTLGKYLFPANPVVAPVIQDASSE